jgi:hypothetical protein
MKPPIPSPAARDCPRCGASIEDARLQFCPHCGAALQTPARLSIGTIISATFLGILCLPMGACSIFVIGSSLTSSESQGFVSVVIVVALFFLCLAALGVLGMIKMLRKK